MNKHDINNKLPANLLVLSLISRYSEMRVELERAKKDLTFDEEKYAMDMVILAYTRVLDDLFKYQKYYESRH